MSAAVCLRDVRAVFFDAVGTVVHPEPSAGTVYAEVGLRHGSRLGPTTIQTRFAAAFRREEERDRGTGFRTNETREVERWRNIVAAVLDDVGDPAACFAELWTHFTRPTSWRCDPDAASLMHRLKAAGQRIGLASNFDARLRSVVAGLPELAGIDHLTISSEVGWRKPAPEFFAAVCRSVGAAPAQVLLVGDDRGNDYDGATAAGLPAVLFDPAGRHQDVAARVSRLDELGV